MAGEEFAVPKLGEGLGYLWISGTERTRQLFLRQVLLRRRL